MIDNNVKAAISRLISYHSSHYPNGAEKPHILQSVQREEGFYIAACETTIAELIELGGIPLRPLGHPYGLSAGQGDTQPTATDYKAESARLSLELTLWKEFKFIQHNLPGTNMCRPIDKARAREVKLCEEDLLDTFTQWFDQKVWQTYHWWILEGVMERAKEASGILEKEINALDDVEAVNCGRTTGEWMRLFDLFGAIADATRVTISESEKVSLNLATDLAERAGSKERFGDIEHIFAIFVAKVDKETEAFAGKSKIAHRTSHEDSDFIGVFRALDCQISYVMGWALSWSVASQDVDLTRGHSMIPTPEEKQKSMLDFLQLRADRFEAFSSIWQAIVPHIEDKIQKLVSQESTGNAAPATLYEDLDRAQKAAMSNLSAAWGMQQRRRMTMVHFNEFNRGMEAPAQQWVSLEAGSSKPGQFLPEIRMFRPVMEKIATSGQTPKVSTAAGSTERTANEVGNAAPRPPTPDEDDLPDYEDFDDEGVWPPQKPEAATERQSKSPSPAPPGTTSQKPEDDEAQSPRYSLSPSSPSNKRKRSPSPSDEEEEDDSPSPRHSPTPPPPPPKRARSASPAHTPSPPPSSRPSPPPASPSPPNNQAAANLGNASPPASPSNKRKRSASPAEEEGEQGGQEAADDRSARRSPTPSPPPAKRARSTSPAAQPSPPKADTDSEDDEPEGTAKKTRGGRKPAAKSKKGKGKAAVTKTGAVTKPKTTYKRKDYRAEAQANGGVRRSKRVEQMKKN